MEDVVGIAYGKTRILLRMDSSLAEWRVIRPHFEPSLPDPKSSFEDAVRKPIGAEPLRELVKSGERVVIVTSDGTRPVPNRLLLPLILDEISVPPENVTILIAAGTHRPNTDIELRAMLGDEIVSRYRVINHDAFDDGRNVLVGRTFSGAPIILNAEYAAADKRIAVGFIEPHFFAGFSGGVKAVVPGVAGIETILHAHRYELISHMNSDWGELEGNILHETIVEMASARPPDFLVNVTLNVDKAVTGVFAGDCMEAHRAGCAHARTNAMVAVPHAFPVVITSNSGHPLDQNLYQTVKGMSAASRVVENGGAIFVASECADGVPSHGRFGETLRRHKDIASVDAWLRGLERPELDQWQIQVLSRILARSEVLLYSSLGEEDARSCKLTPVANLEEAVYDRLLSLGKGASVAVLPDGPLTIPYVE
jgi:nickel-dependent lactate racemase